MLLATLLAFLLAQPSANAKVMSQSVGPGKDAKSYLPADLTQWLNEADHQEILWKIRVEKPVLTFQQRQVVRVTARLDAGPLQEKSVHRSLTFAMKVAQDPGPWPADANYVARELTKPLDANLEITSEVLLRPGKYVIATILYDSVLKEHNVAFAHITVDEPKHDPLPGMLNSVPLAEFVRGDDIEGANAFGDARPALPLPTKRPVRVDLLIDASDREHQATVVAPPDFMSPRGFGGRPPRFRRLSDKSYAVGLLQSASVLSAIQPQNGCVLESSLNFFKKRTVLPPSPAEAVDWRKIYDQELGPVKDTISVNALESRKDLPKFFAEQFYALTGSSGCPAIGDTPVHVVVILSHGLEFPDGSQKVQMEPCNCTVFYLHQADTAMDFDNLHGMLSPLSPRVLEFHDPAQFRQKLAQLLQEIQRLAQ